MDTLSIHAVNILKDGGVIVYPTDTACGIGARIDEDAAVARIYEIKGRDLGKAVPVLFSSIEMVKKYSKDVSLEVENMMQTYWPGALTLVVFANDMTISDLVLGENNKIGVRIPGDQRIREIIESVEVPIVGTSANLSGETTVYNTKDLALSVREKVDFVLEGDCPEKQSSTVLDTTTIPFKILREGAVRLNL